MIRTFAAAMFPTPEEREQPGAGRCPPIPTDLADYIRSLFPAFPETTKKSHEDYLFEAGRASFAMFLLREHERQSKGE